MFWTLDKVVRVMFWGGASAIMACVVSALGLVSCMAAFTALWLLTAAIYLFRADMKESALGKSVIITGCDSGFGNALALHLDKLGFRVFAGCLKTGGTGADYLRRKGSSKLHVIQMDITSQKQLEKAAQEIKVLLPEGEGVWGLVNNAGVCTLGPVEWVSMEGFRKDPEVNVFGLVAATKTFLPLVRLAKGTSLFAVDADVDVQVKTMTAALNQDLRKDYGEDYYKQVESFMKKFRKTGSSDISPVINSLTEALTQTHPQERYCPMTAYRFFVVSVGTHLPEWLYDGLLRL
ncbi:D-beta-hydroxybutyrate dehydrogenase, mitochondrial isoform X2 [Cherax quadricarinatus]|uniref:D-beta-hydroxybutyrate dehydrogenase, mitochondrial isoform X2 n=1 Tax=Cherax quadricarinatus TaxID=27406 RepID=UPI00387E57FE